MGSLPLRVSHIVFDVDGTLVDWDTSYRAAIAAATATASVLGVRVTPEQLQAERDAVLAEAPWQGRTLAAVRHESFRRLVSAAGRPEAIADELASAYFEARNSTLRPFDDVEDTLAELAGRGFTLVSASNGNAALDRLAIARHLAVMHHAEQTGVSKPDPRFFQHVLDLVGAQPQQALAVGDRLENDVRPARSIGMHGVLVDRSGTSADTEELRVTSLRELGALVERA